MTTAAIPARGGRSLLGKIGSAIGASRSQAARKRIAAAYAWTREHVTAIAALSAADLGGFQVFHHGGWFVVAASLVLLDIEVRD